MCLEGEVFQEQRVHRALKADMQFGDIALGQKTVAARGPADRYAIELQWNNFAVEQTDDRDQGPYPAKTGRGKAHRLRPGQFARGGPQQLR